MNTARSRAHAPGETCRRAGREHRASQGGEPRSAPAARVPHQRPCNTPAEERAGTCACRGHDWAPQDPGARRMSAAEPARQDQARVTVRIMDREYVIACPYEERSALLDAAELLNTRMREVSDRGKVV